MNLDQMAKELTAAMQTPKKKTAPYDTAAEVRRIEGDTAWVHIPGGADETPVKMTINAKQGDTVQVRVSGGRAFMVGNATSPPTDDSRAQEAINYAQTARNAAYDALESADTAAQAAERAVESADTANNILDGMRTAAQAAGTTLEGIYQDAKDAETAAGEAKTSAQNASEYAARALGNLSTVQSVTETLNWITAHGTMTLTTDTALDPTHVYFVQKSDGDYVVGGVHYAVVSEPSASDLSTYYELSIDESLNNYVATHLAVTSEGLWIIPDAGGNKVLIATGQGSTYTSAGTYIIGQVDGSDTIIGKFTNDGAQIGDIAGAHSIIDDDGQRFYATDGTTQLANIGYGEGRSQSGTDEEPFYTFGRRYAFPSSVQVYSNQRTYAKGQIVSYGGRRYICVYDITTPEEWTESHWSSVLVGTFSYAEGVNNLSLGVASHAEGIDNFAIGHASHVEGGGNLAGQGCIATEQAAHAEGIGTAARGTGAHAEGGFSVASGSYSHTQNKYTIAAYENQTAIGKYNDNQSDTAFEIGNGTSDTSRSNAFDVKWDGEVELALDTTATTGTDYELYQAITALGWESDVIV